MRRAFLGKEQIDLEKCLPSPQVNLKALVRRSDEAAVKRWLRCVSAKSVREHLWPHLSEPWASCGTELTEATSVQINRFCETAGNIRFGLCAFGILLMSSQSFRYIYQHNHQIHHPFSSLVPFQKHAPCPATAARPHQAGLTAMIGSGEDGDAGQDTRIALSFTQLRVSKLN